MPALTIINWPEAVPCRIVISYLSPLHRRRLVLEAVPWMLPSHLSSRAFAAIHSLCITYPIP